MIREIREKSKIIFNKDYKELGFYLVRFNGTQGILKCNHVEKDNAIHLLRSIKQITSKDVEINTLGTSGTIKSLIKKHMENK